ncbi:hypothetical protein [Hymenobacter antarcticus]|uniref:Glycosyltransferase RgtA/B/C/D-like domain-containing protein n=1 Tax=Hymenobacter antarcticus TaxID=486270 RepID=A0ABP7QSL3_9BACT
MRYLLLLFTVTVLLAALYLAGLYAFTPYATMRAELEAANRQGWAAIAPFALPRLAHTAARYAVLRGTIGVALGGAIVSLVALGRRRIRREARCLGRDIKLVALALSSFWGRLGRGEQWTAGVVLLLILGVRCWFQAHSAFNTDEAVSCDYFVWPGARVTASFYTLPNNHILYNLLGGSLLRLAPTAANPELLLRLPSLLLGFVGTGIAYAVLARLTSFRVATFSLAFMELAPETVVYNISARGYGLQTACVYALFLAVLVLRRGPALHRLAWTVAVAASVAGFYLIPTFIYPFLGLGLGLLAGVTGQPQGKLRAAHTLVGGGAILLVTGLLYLPVGLLSGWPALFTNPYVGRLTATHFWEYFGPYYLWGTVGVLLGSQLVMVPAFLLLVSGGLWLIRRWAPAAWWPAAALAWTTTLAPLPLMILQQVFAPPRTLHYVVFFVLLLAMLLFEAVVRRMRLAGRRAWLGLVLLLMAYAGYRLPGQARTLVADRAFRTQALHVDQWLRAQRPRRILTGSNGYNLYLRHLAIVRRQPLLPVWLVGENPATSPSDYFMLMRGRTLPAWVRPSARLAYEHDYLLIYSLAPSADKQGLKTAANKR